MVQNASEDQSANEVEAVAMAPEDPAPAPAPAPAPKVKKAKEVVVGFNTGMYTETEENAFVEALEMFGRNWRSVG